MDGHFGTQGFQMLCGNCGRKIWSCTVEDLDGGLFLQEARESRGRSPVPIPIVRGPMPEELELFGPVRHRGKSTSAAGYERREPRNPKGGLPAFTHDFRCGCGADIRRSDVNLSAALQAAYEKHTGRPGFIPVWLNP